MLKRVRKLLHEMLAPALFFFVAFSLVDIGDIILHKSAEAMTYSFLVILVSSLVMAKVVLICDLLPCIKHYEKKPLIYNTLWKTFIYLLCTFIVRGLERFVPILIEEKNFYLSFQKMWASFDHVMFWISEVWLASLLLIFVASRELIRAIGKQKIRELFFGHDSK